MFNLMKKDKEKEAGRKEKKDKRDKRERMSAAELRSLDEMSMRRGFFNLNRSSKRESRSKLEISNPIPIKVASSTELSLTDIESDDLSNRSSVVLDADQLSTAGSSDDLKGDLGQDAPRGSVRERAARFGSLAMQSSQVGQIMKRFSFSQRSKEESLSEGSTPSGPSSAAPSPQVEVRLLDPQCTPSAQQQQQQQQQQWRASAGKVHIPEVVEKTFAAELRLPAVVAPPEPEARQLELQRRATGDFGFSLRRTTMLDRGTDGAVYRRVVHFAEPGAGTKDAALGLVPGDRLVEINGRNVESKSRDEIVEMIRQSGETVRLRVQPILELSELSRCWLQSADAPRREAFDVKTEEQIAAEQTWYGSEKMWLVHKDGFSLATLLKPDGGVLPEGKVKIKLEHDGTVLDVDEDDVEKANPPSFDRCEDLAALPYLNESSVMHCLRQRYGGNLIHTHAGPSMVLINPISAPSMYSEKVMHMFKGCRRDDTAPHIYGVAQAAYRCLLTTRQDQAVVLLGKSAGGKSTNCQHLVHYLLSIAGSAGKIFSAEKWQAVSTILEGFGNCATSVNTNASRFSQIVSLDFDQAGQVASASIQTMLLERLRVSRRPEAESTFNVFYYLMAGAESTLRTELHFNHFAETNTFGIAPQTKPEDKQRAAQQFTKLQAALKVLGICADEQKALWLILGAIYHLGAAGATKAGRKQFARHEWAQKAAYLLGCSLEELSSSIFKHQPKGTMQRSTSFRQGPEDAGAAGDNSGPKITALECLEAMAAGLYTELFTLLISLINRALKSSQHSLCSLLIVDTPGFQNPRLSRRPRGASFEELCHNYAQERLQALFHERACAQELERYKEENIELALDDIESSTSLSVAAIDQASTQALVRTLARTDEARGLLWLMEEEALQPGSSEDTLLERLFTYYGPAEGEVKGQHPLFLSHTEKPHHFLLGHSHGTEWVEYDARGWLSYAKQNPASQNAATLLQDSQKRSRVHFVHCLLPKSEAAGTEPRMMGGASPREADAHGESCDAGLMQLDVGLLRAQLRGSKLLDALRIYRQGYPDHMVFSEFRRRFDVLAPHLSKKLGPRVLTHAGVSLGLGVLFRAGVLAKLEERRDLQTRRNLTLFQAACRGFISRQAFKKRKIQDLAIRCIQKNIKKNRGVKDWPWWKLFTTVRPLIEVQLTEEQIRGKDEEIQQLKLKLEKVEKERNELRLNTDRLESRITELSSELADERNTGESASQLLESETSERLRLEKDTKELQTKYDSMKKQMESLEMEVMESRLMRASELNGEMEDDDSGGEWRLKCARAVREVEFTKKRLHQEFEDKLEVEQQGKRQLERRLTDLQADNEEVQRVAQQLKKKCQRLTAELQDTKLHLEGQQSRNHELEKKQRKFDLEQSQAQEEVQRERSQREKLSREKDMLTGEAFSLRQQLEDKDLEMCALNLKLEQMEAELQDLNSQESKDEASLAKVKKQLRDLEAKVKDQEEELDEQAGTIQMLEQAKLRLEMEMERLRQTHAKDLENKDEEVEEIRQSCSKKLKQMEVQLEEEYEDKQKVLRERRELEAKLLTAQDQVSHRDVETEKRLRKDLKRTKALLADAQIMLDHLKNNAPSKREIAQLKNQLEESEFTCAAAVKARKSMEVELEDLHVQMEDISKAKQALEEQLSRVQREKNDLQSRMEEDQEDMNELMKKHKAAVAQVTRENSHSVPCQLTALQSQLEFQEQSMVDKSLLSRQEAKIREMESKFEFEKTQVKRLEGLVSRLKESVEKLTEERDQRSTSESREREQNKRLQRQMRDLKEELAELTKKEAEASRKKHELELDIESLEAANQSLQADLKLAFKRIGDLQAAIEDEMESDDNEDLINSLQDMVIKYQKRKNRTEGDSDSGSGAEDRVDGVKSWLSKNKGSAKNLSDDGSVKGSRSVPRHPPPTPFPAHHAHTQKKTTGLEELWWRFSHHAAGSLSLSLLVATGLMTVVFTGPLQASSADLLTSLPASWLSYLRPSPTR
uniref:Myosin XVIIIAb n=1 Tax=Electrophorus electricus TaxID=8005 RepID=A0A4W4HLT3_ELEEL